MSWLESPRPPGTVPTCSNDPNQQIHLSIPPKRRFLTSFTRELGVIAGRQIVARSSSNLIRDTITISACPIAPWSRPTDGNYRVSYRGCNSPLAAAACVETDNRNKYTRVETARETLLDISQPVCPLTALSPFRKPKTCV